MAIAESTALATSVAKASSIAILISMLDHDLNLVMVLIVGVLGGAIYSFKEYVYREIKLTKLKLLAEILFTIPLAVSTSGIVYYFGTEFVNTYMGLGNAIWVFAALMSALHYKNVMYFFSDVGARVINKKVDDKKKEEQHNAK